MQGTLLGPAATGKRDNRALMAAGEPGQHTRRLFVTDAKTKIAFLVDRGADICVYPRRMVREPRQKSANKLSATNGTVINTYGMHTLILNFGLQRVFTWRFVVADVSRSIIGADILAHYGLMVDLRNARLIDQLTNLAAPERCIRCDALSVKAVTRTTSYHRLLEKYLDVKRPEEGSKEPIHATRHYIETTPRPPVVCRPRRLNPAMLTVVKKEFSKMLEIGVARLTKDCWSLHLRPKKGEEWRLCGNYQALNVRTIPDRYPVRHFHDFAQALQDKNIFSTLDFVRAYHQIPVAAEDVPKTTITTPFGMYEFQYMSFGLRNAAQTFQW